VLFGDAALNEGDGLVAEIATPGEFYTTSVVSKARHPQLNRQVVLNGFEAEAVE
jgi:hypothetical protein